MLNKDICEKCLQTFFHEKAKGMVDLDWKIGKVFCPVKLSEFFTLHKKIYSIPITRKEPPAWCPYALEHLMAEEQC